MAKNLDPRIDAYIADAADFARPILNHLRALVHRACPQVEETMKWSMPYFVMGGKNLCHLAAFKAHCAFGFWHPRMREELGADGARADEGMGSFGRITSFEDLPGDSAMIRHVKRAAELNAQGVAGRTRPATAKSKSKVQVPPDLTAALKKNKAAAATFENFSPSHRREYVEWITEAKRDETRRRRLATTLAWLAEGKPRDWKYAR